MSSPKMSCSLDWLTCLSVMHVTWEETPGRFTGPTYVSPHIVYPTAYEHTFCRTISTHSGAGE